MDFGTWNFGDSASCLSSFCLFDLCLISLKPPHKRAKLTKYIPEDKFSPGKFDVEIIHLADMERHYSLFVAQLDLVAKDPTLISSPGEFCPF